MIKHQKQMVLLQLSEGQGALLHIGGPEDDFMEKELEFYLQGLGGFGVCKEDKSKLGGKCSWVKYRGGHGGW